MTRRTRENCVPSGALRETVWRAVPADTTITSVAHQTGVREEVVYNLLGGETHVYDWTSFTTADQILTGLGLCHLWHTEDALVEVGEYLDARAAADEAEKARPKAAFDSAALHRAKAAKRGESLA